MVDNDRYNRYRYDIPVPRPSKYPAKWYQNGVLPQNLSTFTILLWYLEGRPVI